MSPTPSFAGDAISEDHRIIEIRVSELSQLFNDIDPSPFRKRDLDPRAEQFIVEWSADFPARAPLALVVHLERTAGATGDARILREAIAEYFGQRAIAMRRDLRELFRRGRISLAIALAFLTTSIVIGDAIATYFRESPVAEVIREGFLIGGWVAMWRPIEVFLYDWWPIRAEARRFDRLSKMPVRIECKKSTSSEAGLADSAGTNAILQSAASPSLTDSTIQSDLVASNDGEHQHTLKEEWRIREAALDQTIESSFPASDPPSSNPNPDDHTAVDRALPRQDENA